MAHHLDFQMDLLNEYNIEIYHELFYEEYENKDSLRGITSPTASGSTQARATPALLDYLINTPSSKQASDICIQHMGQGMETVIIHEDFLLVST
jgi:hypothetical protein